MKKQELQQIIKEELNKVLTEAKIDIPDQGYGADYYNIKSDIMEQWDDLAIITKDIKGFLEAAHEAGGPKLVRQAMNAILAGVKDSQTLFKINARI